MGSSPSASLFYGYVFSEENTFPWEDEDEYEKNESFRERDWETRDFYIHKVLGKTEAEVDAMGWEEKSAIEKGLPVSVDSWGGLAYDQSCYLITPKDDRACFNGSWDGPTSVNPKDMEPNAEWDEVLKDFAEKMGVDLKGQEPGWHLVASYG